MDEGAEDPRYMASLGRGLQVLRAFEGHATLSVSEAAAICGLSRSSAGRCLYTLERLGYVQGDVGRFRLLPGVLRLASAYSWSDPLANAAQPVLDDIRDRLGESSSLAVMDPQSRGEVIYIARAAAPRIISAPLQIGATLPAYCTSMGRVILADLSDARRAEAIGAAPLVKRTSVTLTDTAALNAEIERVRAQGYSIVDGELEAGLRSISAPVRSAGAVVAAINVATTASRRAPAWLLESALPELQAAAAHLSRSIG